MPGAASLPLVARPASSSSRIAERLPSGRDRPPWPVNSPRPPILQTSRLSSNPSLGNTRQVQREAGWGKSRRAVQGCRGALQQYQELWPATDFDDTTFSLIASVVRNPGGSGNPMSGVVVADSDSAPPRASISSALITSASSAARRSPSRSGREPARACFSCPTSPIRSQRSARSSPPG